MSSDEAPGDPRAIAIGDPDDPRLDPYRRLREREHRAPRPGAEHGTFIGESLLVVERMLARPGCARSVLVLPSRVRRLADRLPEGVPLYVAERDVMSRVAGFPIHRGVLAEGNRPRAADLELEAVIPAAPARSTLLVVEGVTHPDNIGMLFRVAAAFAVDAVVLSPDCHDPLYRRAVRLSIGHVLDMRWAWARDWGADLDRLAEGWGYELVGAATDRAAVAVGGAPALERLALVVGTEAHGLSDATLRRLRTRVRVPMAPGVDSLNVAVAAAVCLDRMSTGKRV